MPMNVHEYQCCQLHPFWIYSNVRRGEEVIFTCAPQVKNYRKKDHTTFKCLFMNIRLENIAKMYCSIDEFRAELDSLLTFSH